MEGVEMEEQRVSAVRSWSIPNYVKAVQRFLGFANYLRKFIRGFSTVVAPLTSLLRGGDIRDAEGTLHHCFRAGTSDPSLPFNVEVDASKVGVGAVLSQRTGTPPKLRAVPSTPSS